MLPPDFAAFGFVLDAAGADAAVSQRTQATVAAHGGRRVVVIGAQRWGLVAALARTPLAVTAVDPSRGVLANTRQALEDAGLGGRVTLFATDPRDVEIPEGADAVLVTSALWRMLLHVEAQRAALRSIARALRGPSLLLLDLDRAPPLADGAPTHLRDGPGRQRWTAERTGDIVRVRCASPGVAEIALDLSAMSPEATIDETRAAGFETVAATDAADGGPFRSDSVRMWLVARNDRSARRTERPLP